MFRHRKPIRLLLPQAHCSEAQLLKAHLSQDVSEAHLSIRLTCLIYTLPGHMRLQPIFYHQLPRASYLRPVQLTWITNRLAIPPCVCKSFGPAAEEGLLIDHDSRQPKDS